MASLLCLPIIAEGDGLLEEVCLPLLLRDDDDELFVRDFDERFVESLFDEDFVGERFGEIDFLL